MPMRIKSRTIRKLWNRTIFFMRLHWYAFAPIPADGKICFFKRDRKDYSFFSNFFPVIITINGSEYPHVEAYYQSRKSDNPEYHKRVLHNKSPAWAKYVGDSRIGSPYISKKSWFKKHPEDLRKDWSEIRIEVMKRALYAKFRQHKLLLLSLINTMDAELIEDSEKDPFWGIGIDGKGKNMLGVLLMELMNGFQNERKD